MGIKDLVKLISGETVDIKKYLGETITIDAMIELYRASLGMRGDLTDKNGKPTQHLSVIVNNIIKYKTLGIGQIWVFDSSEADPMKAHEDALRKERKESAKKKLDELDKLDVLYGKSGQGIAIDVSKPSRTKKATFSDSEDEDDQTKKKKAEKEKKKDSLKKQTFHITEDILRDAFMILDAFNIPYMIAPPGIQAECVCAALTKTKSKYKVYAVLSQDTDSLLFGSKRLIKRNTKEKTFTEYSLSSIKNELDIRQNDLIKIGIVLGCDFYKDERKLFFRIGQKKVLSFVKNSDNDKKFEDPDVVKAIEVFRNGYKNFENIIEKATKFNFEKLSDSEYMKKKTNLLKWLVEERSFNEDRWKKLLKV